MVTIRAITQDDDPEVAAIIRQVLTEYGANRPGFAWQDPELDYMTRAYSGNGSEYLVVIDETGALVGGGGVAAFQDLRPNLCELQKMYLLPEARGKGAGLALITSLLESAARLAYQGCYLETLETMREANGLYQKLGFKLLEAPLGNSGHNACDRWYLKELEAP